MNYDKAAWYSACVYHDGVDTECELCMQGVWINPEHSEIIGSKPGEPLGQTYWKGLLEMFKTNFPNGDIVSDTLMTSHKTTDFTL